MRAGYTKDAALIGIYGRRGSGKSTLTAALIKGRPKVIVFDPRDEYGGPGRMVRCATPDDVIKAAKARWQRGFQLAYVPPAGEEAESLHQLITEALWPMGAPYDAGRDPRKITLVVEEMDLSFPVHQLPAGQRGMQAVCNQGRHVGIECIAVTQRPNQINKAYRANCAVQYVFALADADDRGAILRTIGREHEAALRDLPPFHYLRYENGQVVKEKTKPPGRK